MSNGVAALTVTVLGTGTTALMLKSAWVRGWLYHGQHLTASAVYGRELYASGDVAFYAVICVVFPILGLMMGASARGCQRDRSAAGKAARRARRGLVQCRIRRTADGWPMRELTRTGCSASLRSCRLNRFPSTEQSGAKRDRQDLPDTPQPGAGPVRLDGGRSAPQGAAVTSLTARPRR